MWSEHLDAYSESSSSDQYTHGNVYVNSNSGSSSLNSSDNTYNNHHYTSFPSTNAPQVIATTAATTTKTMSRGYRAGSGAHARGISYDTNNIDFGNYLDLYSEPVKKLLKSQLEEKLDRRRRPTIDDLQDAGIWHPADPNGPTLSTHHSGPDAQVSPLPSAPVSATSPGDQAELSRYVNKWVQSRRRTIHELERKGVLQKDYFTNYDSDATSPATDQNGSGRGAKYLKNRTQASRGAAGADANGNGNIFAPRMISIAEDAERLEKPPYMSQISVESAKGGESPPSGHVHSLYSMGNMQDFAENSGAGGSGAKGGKGAKGAKGAKGGTNGTSSLGGMAAANMAHGKYASVGNESVNSVMSTALSDWDSNSDIELMEHDLYHTHSHQIMSHSEQNNVNKYDKYDTNNSNRSHNNQNVGNTAGNNANNANNNAKNSGGGGGGGLNENIHYYNIPEHLDGGMLSSWVFLPYKQWCEAEVTKLMNKYDQVLTEMKMQSRMVQESTSAMQDDEHFYSQAGTNGNIGMNLYDDDGDAAEALKHAKRQSQLDPHIERLMNIEQRLSDNKERSKRIYKIHSKIKNIQKQFDTHVDRMREDQMEMLEIVGEMRERFESCNRTLKEIRNAEVWLITNIADTIAERSEKMDSMTKNIRKTAGPSERQSFSLEYDLTKKFVGELIDIIHELQRITEGKNKEVERLKDSIDLLTSQNRHLNNSSKKSSNVVLQRLHELQSHYKLPPLLEQQGKDNNNLRRRNDSILASIEAYCSRVETFDYYSRSLELYHSACIYSNESYKIFFNTLVMNCNQVLIDASIVYEFITTNHSYANAVAQAQNSGQRGQMGQRGNPTIESDEVQQQVQQLQQQQRQQQRQQEEERKRREEREEQQLEQEEMGTPYHHTSTRTLDDARETQHKLEVALTPVQLNPMSSSVSYIEQEFLLNTGKVEMSEVTPDTLLNYCLENFDLEGIEIIKNLSEKYCQEYSRATKKYNAKLLRKVAILARWARKIPHRETVISCVAQNVAVKFEKQIDQCTGKESIHELAMRHCLIIMSTALCTSNDPDGIIKCMRNCRRDKTNVYTMASQILYKIYDMSCACPV